MTPEEREQFVEDIAQRVTDKLTPLLDEWIEEFERKFVINYSDTFDKHFDDCMKVYSINFEKREV